MRFSLPKHFSKEWWSILISGAVLFGIATAVLLKWMGLVPDPFFFLLVMLGAGIGDIAVALSIEAVSPATITIRPGERIRHDSDLSETGEIIAGFGSNRTGRISVRGEIWNAKCTDTCITDLEPGGEVRILGREGLVLLVDGGEFDT
jgi:membrane-bound ClpP family serine protease